VLNCTFFVYDSVSAAKTGDQCGASGFLVAVNSQEYPAHQYVYAITTSHVIRKGTVLRFNTAKEPKIIPTEKRDWEPHRNGDDVAAMAIDLPPEVICSVVPSNLFIDMEIMEKFNVGPGDEATLICRFSTHEGKGRNLPTARFGNISMLPWEPILRDDGVKQDSFLVECRSLPGYSGSPVFLDAVPHQRVGIRKPGEIPPFCLLGIDWGHLPRFAPLLGEDKKTPDPERRVVEMNSGMSCVIPAWKITELLEEDKFKMQRKQADEEIRKQPAAVSDNANEPPLKSQRTPKGYEITVPTKAKFLSDLGKASRKKK
jgi:hypothetical protein